MNRPARHRRKGGRRGDGPDSGGGGSGGSATKTMPTMELIKVAEKMLKTFHQMDEREPNAHTDDPEGSLVGSEKLVYPFIYKDRNRTVSIPRILLKTSHDFQLGCVYGILMQKVKPAMAVCMDCGKKHEPVFGFSRGVIVDTIQKSRLDRRE